MNQADVLPDPNIDDFDPVGELDYGEDEPDVPGPVNDPQQPSFSGNRRVNSSDSLPGMIDGDRDSIPSNIGPALPPGFIIGNEDDGTPDDPADVNRPPRDNIGPSLPPGFGPSLPDDEHSGLPAEPSTNRSIGPTLPPHLANLQAAEDDEEEEEDEAVDLYGPALPPPDNAVENDDDNVVVGPLPPTGGNNIEQEAEEYALRRLAYEREQEEKANNTGREEWMLHLPKKLNNYGLGARTFSKGGGAEKDSSWEETPNQKRRKLNTDEASTSGLVVAAALKSRDAEQEKIADQLNRGRNESLLDSHQKTRQQTVENGSTNNGARRPFDREKDMEVRGLKNASADEIKQKCGNLGTRFSSSNQQKFL